LLRTMPRPVVVNRCTQRFICLFWSIHVVAKRSLRNIFFVVCVPKCFIKNSLSVDLSYIASAMLIKKSIDSPSAQQTAISGKVVQTPVPRPLPCSGSGKSWPTVFLVAWSVIVLCRLRDFFDALPFEDGLGVPTMTGLLLRNVCMGAEKQERGSCAESKTLFLILLFSCHRSIARIHNRKTCIGREGMRQLRQRGEDKRNKSCLECRTWTQRPTAHGTDYSAFRKPCQRPI